MSNIKKSINQFEEPAMGMVDILINFYNTMKQFELSDNKVGKQALLIVITVNDIEKIIKSQ